MVSRKIHAQHLITATGSVSQQKGVVLIVSLVCKIPRQI